MIVASLPNVLPPAIGSDWWLPTNYSPHGHQIDILFIWIFWLTGVVGVAVLGTLAYFCVRYRHRKGQAKGVFIHGNTRLEMIWTLVPAVILILIAVFTKRVWDNYRYNPYKDSETVKILVIGQQFKWNVIYPGPDGKLGRYMAYPKTTDMKWPDPPPGENPWPAFALTNVPGPAYLPEAQARKLLNDFIETNNPLGKDFSDPDGKDDDWRESLRNVYLPKGRPIEIDLGSRDVIHDFFAPNFRVKLDALPGTRGLIFFSATTSSAEIEKASHRPYQLEDLKRLLAVPNPPEYHLIIADSDPRSDLASADDPTSRRYYKNLASDAPITTAHLKQLKVAKVKSVFAYDAKDPSTRRQYTISELKTAMAAENAPEYRISIPEDAPGSERVDPRNPTSKRFYKDVKDTVLRNDESISLGAIADLQSIGLTEVTAYEPMYWDVVCEQLCGAGHYTMRGKIVVLEADEYKRRFETAASAANADNAAPPAPTAPISPTAAAVSTAAPR